MGYKITFHKKAYTDTMNLPDGILAQLLHIFEELELAKKRAKELK